MRVTALDGEDLAQERRLGVYFLINGAVVGFAWRIIAVVSHERDVASVRPPSLRERELIDLPAVAREEAPDLVLAVFRADDTQTQRFTWAAYPLAANVAVPDVKRSFDLGGTAAKFATNARRHIYLGGPADPMFDWLKGVGRDIGRSIPQGIRTVIRRVAEMPGRKEPATVLLFTEEEYVPWELAVFEKPPLKTAFGGSSPFLGAHIAVGRWPLTERKPRPIPPRRVDVHSQAVFTAEYNNGARWPKLPAAEKEATELAEKYPPSTMVRPLYRNVMDCLEGHPAVDVMHFALHGQFDPDGIDEGLVLLSDEGGTYTSQYLQREHIEGVDFGHAPFVFLNACQVGAAKDVLGDYAGMAAAFLHAGAAGVIAPLWNVDDRIASALAREFYEAAYSADGPSVAEVLRRVRARYTKDAAAAGAADTEGYPTIGPTLIAYQLFGHPRLRLMRRPDANGALDD